MTTIYGFVIAVLVLLFTIVFFAKALKIVPQAYTMVIERLGKYNRTLQSGVNMIIPILDKPRVVQWTVDSKDGLSRNKKVHG